VGLLAAALVGAGLVHLLAYHLPPGVPFGLRWDRQALALLVRCPLVGPLGLIATIAVLAPLLAFHELQRLDRLNRALTRLLAARHVPVSPACEVVPRSPWRLVGFVALLLSVQVALLSVASALWPMRLTMVMEGGPMTMIRTPALPLAPLHLAVAVLLALLLWRIERRLVRLRAEIARRLHLLCSTWREQAALLPEAPARLPHAWASPGHFARPPPPVTPSLL
jgi:hypothetical protein